MDIKTLLIILIPSVLSFATALTSILVGYKRDKQRRANIAWETTEKIIFYLLNNDLYSARIFSKTNRKDADMLDEFSLELARVYDNLYYLLRVVEADNFEKYMKTQQEHLSKKS